MYLSQYFPPEMGAPPARVDGFSRLWAAWGHDVSVLTAFPHHPTGVVPRGYRRKRFARETRDGVTVVRTWIYPSANRGLVRRTLSYLSFMISAIFTGFFALRPHDVIIATSPQFFVAVAGWVLSVLGRGRFILEVRDLWPDSIIAVGALRSPWIIRPLKRLERFLYRQADRIVVVTESSKQILEESGVPAEKISVVTNGVELDRFRPGEEPALRRRLGVDGRFVVSYIGTIGMAHALDVVLRAAEAMPAESDVLFVIVGEGALRKRLEDESQARGLRNVRFAGEQARERIPALLRASQACLVHLKRADLFKTVIPSKIFEIMACGRPILMGVGGEAARLVERAGAGIVFESENDAQLREAIHTLQADPDGLRRMGEAGRRFVETGYGRGQLARRYAALLGR